jgi:flagellar hook-associated protein 3 FlgL
MRISTLNFYDSSVNSIESAQTSLAQTQQTIATGKQVNTPSDNPLAASQIVQTSSNLGINTQFASNLGVAQNLLTLTDSTLGSASNLLVNVRSLLVSAGNGGLSAADRSSLATQLQQQLSQLVGLANTQDGDGNYIFGGSNATSAPFVQNSNGVTYTSNDIARNVQVTGSQQVAATVTGYQTFQKVSTGNGVFATGASAANTGSAAIDTGQVVTPSAITGDHYAINFTVAGGQTTYDVVDTTTGNPVNAPAATNNVYTSGSNISFDGLSVTVTGSPANGDSFSVAPSTTQSVFTSIQQAITDLQNPSTGANGGLETNILNVDNAIQQMSSVESEVGARQNLVTTLTSENSSQGLSDQSTLSNLQDTDMAKAASNLAEQQTVLQAAEESFTKIAADSLFNYLPPS